MSRDSKLLLVDLESVVWNRGTAPDWIVIVVTMTEWRELKRWEERDRDWALG